jgi:sugar phosphate permease
MAPRARPSSITGDAAGSAEPRAPYRWAILAAGVVGQASYSAVLVGPAAIASPLQHSYNLSLPSLGTVLAAANLGSLLTLFAWGVLSDREGERLVLTAGLGAAGVCLVAAAWIKTAPGLVLVLAAAGALGSGVNSASGRAVMSWFGADERGLALGIRQTAFPIGGAIGAFALPRLVDGVDLRPAFFFLAGGCLVAAVVGAIVLRGEVGEDRRIGGPRLLRDGRLWRLGVSGLLLVLAQISLISFIPLFLHRHRDLSLAAAGSVLAITQVLGAVARITAGWVSDRAHTRIRPIRYVAVCLVATLAASSLLVDSSLVLLVSALVAAGTLGLSWNGLSFTATAELAGTHRAGAAIGLQQTLLSTGATVAPIAFAAVVAATTWRVGFALAAVGPALALAVLRPLREPAVLN